MVIAGGGVAALEAALALRELAGDRVAVTLLSGAADFVYRPMSVVEPFDRRSPRRLPLARFASAVGAALERDQLSSVDVAGRVVRTRGRHELPYDALVLAIGATAVTPLPNVPAIGIAHMNRGLRRLVYDVDRGALSSLALVVPRPAWPLPAYELALLVSERARQKAVSLAVTILTAEERPVQVFGDEVGDAVATMLSRSSVAVIYGVDVRASGRSLLVGTANRQLEFDRVLAVPRLQGPAIEGLPADEHGFVPVTPLCEVIGAERVYAAGDATQFPVKFGGIAAQQADAAASAIAALAGAPCEPAPFDGTVRGMVLGGGTQPALCFSAVISGATPVRSEVGGTQTASANAKISARHLGPYLDTVWPDGPRWVDDQHSWETTLRILEAQSRHRAFTSSRAPKR
ncbi:MAG: FAD-dependent oxidoreductase [Solirubrobacteraceae bacterium]